MTDACIIALKWAAVLAGLSPVLGGIGWVFWELTLRPWLIPRADIERRAEETLRRYPDNPEGAAFMEEQAAWYRSRPFDQGLWRRVRKEIARRGRRA